MKWCAKHQAEYDSADNQGKTCFMCDMDKAREMTPPPTDAMGDEDKENAAIGSAIREALLLAATTGSDPHLAIGVVAYAAGFAAGAAAEREACARTSEKFFRSHSNPTMKQWAIAGDIATAIRSRALALAPGVVK